MKGSTMRKYLLSLPEMQAIVCQQSGARVTEGEAFMRPELGARMVEQYGADAVVWADKPAPARKPKTTRSKAKAKPAPIPAEAPAKVEG